MKQITTVLLSIVLIVSMGTLSFGASETLLGGLGKAYEVSGTVETLVDTKKVSAKYYPSQMEGMFNEINAQRRKAGVTELTKDPNLEEAAKQRALETSVSMAHSRPNGKSWSSVSTHVKGENLAMNTMQNYLTTMQAFMNSPTHKDNILDPDFTSVQVYCLTYDGSLYWVQLFGTASNGTAKTTPTKAAPTKKTPAKGTLPPTSPTTTGKVVVSENSVGNAISSASVINGAKKVIVANANEITPSTLTALKKEAGQYNAILQADTTTNKATTGRITINASTFPEQKSNVGLGVHVGTNRTKVLETKFSSLTTGHVSVVSLEHKGSFGGNVRVTALANLTAMDTSALTLYSFDSTEDCYQPIPNAKYTLENGYISFITNMGGDIVITDSALV